MQLRELCRTIVNLGTFSYEYKPHIIQETSQPIIETGANLIGPGLSDKNNKL